jgi:hypothetical protein
MVQMVQDGVMLVWDQAIWQVEKFLTPASIRAADFLFRDSGKVAWQRRRGGLRLLGVRVSVTLHFIEK